MYTAKAQITDALGSNNGDLFRSLVDHPGFKLLEAACYAQIANSSPGEFGSEIIQQQYFFGAGMKGVFDIADQISKETSAPMEELEVEADPELQAQLLD